MNKPIPLAGYNGFNKRTGVADVAEGLGGRPRSLEFEDGVEAQPLVQSVSEADLEPVENVDENKLDSQTEQSRRRRSLRDANGNRVLAVRRVKRETVEEDEAEEADIETERIIQVRCLILTLCSENAEEMALWRRGALLATEQLTFTMYKKD